MNLGIVGGELGPMREAVDHHLHVLELHPDMAISGGKQSVCTSRKRLPAPVAPAVGHARADRMLQAPPAHGPLSRPARPKRRTTAGLVDGKLLPVQSARAVDCSAVTNL